MATIEDRGYVRIDKKRLLPEDKGRLVTAFLASYFDRYVEYDFTADLEEKLDLISDGKLEWKQVLREFWRDFTGAIDDTKDLRVGQVLEALNEILGPHIFPDKGDGTDPRLCPKCSIGRLSMKISGKFGAFIGCSNYPDCRFTRQFSDMNGEQTDAATADGKILGQDPQTGLDVLTRSGRFGPYLQLGEGSKEEKPKRSGVPKGLDLASIDLEMALRLLSLPREIGAHPDSGSMITAALGQYGPYVKHEKTYANLPNWEDLFTIGINHAVVLIADKVAGKGGRFGRAAQKTVLKDLGEHPDGGQIEVLSGKYGPYVSHNKINANVPKGKEPAEVTVAEAIELLAARAEQAGKGGARRKAAAKGASAKPKATSSKAGGAKKAAKKKVAEAAEG